MPDHRVQYILSTAIVASGILIVSACFAFGLLGWLGEDQMETTLGIVVPGFAGYVAASVRRLLKSGRDKPALSRSIPIATVVIVLATPTILSAIIGAAIYKQALGGPTGFYSFGQFQSFLICLQTTFSVVLGGLVYPALDDSKSALLED